MKFPCNKLLWPVIILVAAHFSISVQAQSINTDYSYSLTNSFLGDGRTLEANSTVKIPLFMGHKAENIGQKWKLIPLGDGKYHISNHLLGDQWCLDTYYEDGSSLFFGVCSNSASQSWTLVPTDGGYYNILDWKGRALDNDGGGTFRPLMAAKGNYSGQYWKLTPLEANADLQYHILVYDKPLFEGEASPVYFNPATINTPIEGFNQLSALSATWANRISSIQVPDGYKVIIYNQPGFQGSSMELKSSWTALPDFPQWDKTIASFRIVSADAYVAPTIPIENIPPTPPAPPVPVQTSITTSNYYNISNKSQDEQYKLNFSIPDNALLLQNIPGYWKLEPVTGGSYQWDGTSYSWKQQAASNLFRILLFINGKYWALSATKDGYPKITEISLMDMYQTWAIDFQSDGYYKITNSNLGAANLPNAVLFCTSDKKLFMADWDESKSFNGRWKLLEAGAIPANKAPDKFDSKRFTLTSAKTNQAMCAEYIYTSDATQELFIIPCKNNNSAKFIFQKTISGDYFMIVEGLRDGIAYTNYLDDRLSAVGKENFDLTNPNLQYTWKIIEMDYGRYKVKNSLTNEALEFIPGIGGFPAGQLHLASDLTALN